MLETDCLLKPAEAATISVTLATIYTKASRRQLPTVKVGRQSALSPRRPGKLIKAGLRPALRPLADAVDGPGDEQ